MAKFDAARFLAETLIEKNGRDVTLVLNTDEAATPGPDPRPWSPPADQEPAELRTVKAVILDAKRQFMDDTLTKVAEKIAYVAVQKTGEDDVAISKKYVIRDKGRDYRILELTLLGPGEQDILYTLELVS